VNFFAYLWLKYISCTLVWISHNSKGTVVPVDGMVAFGGNAVKFPSILNLGTGWKWVVRFTRLLFYAWQNAFVTNRLAGSLGCRMVWDILENRQVSWVNRTTIP